ncbi:MAG: hypothetical protein Q7J45_02055 [bacterium]|nr:hypothetical protein [bacterium]
MGRVLSIIYIIAGLLSATVVIYKEERDISVIDNEIPTQAAPAIQRTAAAPTGFNETGTLIFYPNNVGPVPYIFYQDRLGRTVAKALVFPSSTPTNFASWTGARISIMGQIASEHVVVSRMTHLSGP